MKEGFYMIEKRDKLMEEYEGSKRLYIDFTDTVKELIQKLLIGEDIKYASIASRVKEQDSLYSKIERKDYKYNAIGEITDICGIRIITYYSDVVNKVADLISGEFYVDQDNTIDKSKVIEPDRFGYLSMHYVIGLKKNRTSLPEYSKFKGLKVEVQIRSMAQHLWAEIEHDLGYKNELEVPKEVRRSFSRMAGLLEIADREFISIRNELEKYGEKVEEQFMLVTNKERYNLMPIDSVTLTKYIKDGKNLNKVNERIADFVKVEMIDRVEGYGSTLHKLNYLGYKTIEELDKDIEDNQEHIVNIAKKLLGDKIKREGGKNFSTLHNDIGIFYLMYSNLAKDGCEKGFKKYFREFNMLSSGERDEDEFIRTLIDVYQKTEKK